MSLLVALDLPKAPLKLSSKAGRIYVQCLLRRKSILLTQEEWVRQHLIAFLHHQQGFPLEKMAIEKEIQYDGFKRRWDLVIYDDKFQAQILLECKAPQIKLTHEVFIQIATYQSKIQAPYLILSNGLVHLIYEVDFSKKSLKKCLSFPVFEGK
jgi:hypothetical protein